ncbi:alpha-amylase family protein [Parenemella sanctibonifatiensis]|uniref:Alpha-amylase n=1 Tax=Parenemella sanctibonifatiensis TaxID=2016505 RepID=A0A255ENJ5_9ACTN|nr:alpha-amylase family protein [Parenemella sanctibonifatiensis]OYN91042.1 alpha-amylase [Parenemella sanctibonifatiensis]
MNWVDHAIWWHTYPLGLAGAPIRDAQPAPAHGLQRLLPWLDHVIELGASGLLLGPIFASASHGYDTLDHFTIDPRLGDDADFDELVEQCRRRGLRILLDGVFSHVADQHPALLDALAEGPESEAAGLFDIDWETRAPRVWEGHGQLARLDHAGQPARELVASVMRHWLARGVDGWRLDAAYSVPVEFWSAVLPGVREEFPDAWFLGEVIHGDYPKFVAEAGVDSLTQYELWKAIWSSINDGNLYELDHAVQRHQGFLNHFTPNTFVGNHDVTRIATTLGPSGAVSALAVLLTLGGIPSIYYGDEYGFTGTKEERVGGDDAVRPELAVSPAEQGMPDHGPTVVDAHRALIALRRRHAWLVTATTEATELSNTRYAYRSSAADGSDHLDVVIDLGGTPPVTITGADGATLWRQSA